LITYSFLQELEGTLILGNLQQFHGSLFIRSMSRDFLDNVSDEFGMLGQFLRNNTIKSVGSIFSHFTYKNLRPSCETDAVSGDSW
jgi:hypothetical protein